MSGNIGIGTTGPAEKLDVNGAIKVGNTTTNNAGSIRWTGSAFQGYNGSSWNTFGTTGTGGWVNFNGTGANGTNMTIRGSSNVTSVYKNSGGDYTINWTTPFANANYCLSGLASGDISGDSRVVAIISLSAGSARIVIRNTGGSKSNTSLITVMAID